LRVPLPT